MASSPSKFILWNASAARNKRKAWISAPLHKRTVSEITEAVGINTDFFFQAKIVFSPAVQ